MSEKTLVCMPADSAKAVAGSNYDHLCTSCAKRVMIAPSGQQFLRSNPDAETMCAPCYLKRIDAFESVDLAADPETLRQESRSVIPNPFRSRN